jgi:hypothetical protein
MSNWPAEGFYLNTCDNAHRIAVWLRHQKTATASQIAAHCMLGTDEALAAVQFGLRHAAFRRMHRRQQVAAAWVQYGLTGKPLPGSAVPCVQQARFGPPHAQGMGREAAG